MLERERLESKKISKTNAVTSQLDYDMGAKNVHIGPCDYVAWLDDRKWAYIRMEGRTFGDVPLNIELQARGRGTPPTRRVSSSTPCAARKLALDRGISGALFGPSSYFMKSPPEQYTDDEAHLKTEAYIADGANVSEDVPAESGGAPAAPEAATDGADA